MIKLICEENNIEYAGSGYLQCGRHVNCPKKKNNKVLGFDCLIYIDNLPDGCQLDISEGYKDDSAKAGNIRDVVKSNISDTADNDLVEITARQKSDKRTEQEVVDLSPVLDVRSMVQKYNRATNGGM